MVKSVTESCVNQQNTINVNNSKNILNKTATFLKNVQNKGITFAANHKGLIAGASLVALVAAAYASKGYLFGSNPVEDEICPIEEVCPVVEEDGSSSPFQLADKPANKYRATLEEALNVLFKPRDLNPAVISECSASPLITANPLADLKLSSDVKKKTSELTGIAKTINNSIGFILDLVPNRFPTF